MQNSNSYIISEQVELGAAPVVICKDNRSRSAVIISNKSSATITFGTLGEVSTVRGVDLTPGQTVTITEQYDGDFARIQLTGIATAEGAAISVYQVMTYRETTR